MEQVDSMTQAEFVASFADVYEHSPWVAVQAYAVRPFQTMQGLHVEMQKQVEAASREKQMALICAHPDLGTRARVSESSADEQSSAGLDRLTSEEYDRLLQLNQAYKEKFSFPFIFAVKGSGKQEILTALELRLRATPAQEFSEALRQIYRIAQYRLEEKLTQ